MKLITAFIRPDKLAEVKTRLFRAGVTGLSISRVSGHGGEREVVDHRRTETVMLRFQEVIKLELVCSDPFIEPTVLAILGAARSGQPGDGKILIQAIRRVIRIRTGEENEFALTPVNAEQVQLEALEQQPE